MSKKISLAVFMFVWALAGPAQASEAQALFVAGTSQAVDGTDRVFSFDLRNPGPRAVSVRGVLTVTNVYSASLPSTLAIENVEVPSSGSSRVAVRWHNAPLFGRAKLTLALYEGASTEPSVVALYHFWLLPGTMTLMLFGGGVLLFIALIALALRLIKRRASTRVIETPRSIVLKMPHVPSNMIAYAVENGDTVMTLSNRFEVSWQDLVRANRLKPPYALKPGSLLLIPKHPFKPHVPSTKL